MGYSQQGLIERPSSNSQWFVQGLRPFNAMGLSLIPGLGTKVHRPLKPKTEKKRIRSSCHDYPKRSHQSFGMPPPSQGAEELLHSGKAVQNLGPSWRSTHTSYTRFSYYSAKPGCFQRIFSFLFFFFLASPVGMQDLSFPTRDQTRAPCIGSSEFLTTGRSGKSPP